MKYAKVIINISNHNMGMRHKDIVVNIPRINVGATQVSISLREKESVSRYDNFHIMTTYTPRVMVACDELRIPFIAPENGNLGMVETRFFDECFPYMILNTNVNHFIQKIIKSLYYWDKRCQRSVRVKVKEKEDLPLEIVYNGNKVSVALEQMITFADFIKNN
jgi:hypothetical protein